MKTDVGTLDRRLLAAHACGDPEELTALYAEAGDLFEAAGDIDAACFYLTQALVYALEAGGDRAAALQQRLCVYGRADCPPGTGDGGG